MTTVDVAVLGAGLAGLATAYHLRGHHTVQVLESGGAVGGRTRSLRTGLRTWANLGAQYVSADKARVHELAAAVGVELVAVDELWGTTVQRLAWLHAHDPEGIDRVCERLRQEQSNPRDPAGADLDDTTFAQWLGEVADPVLAYFGQWCRIVLNAGVHDVSVYSVLLAWGAQRTSPWTIDGDVTGGRRSSVVLGGTSVLTDRLAAASGAEIALGTQVTGVRRDEDGFQIVTQGPAGSRTYCARRVVCTLPAPVALRVIDDLPPWKRAALASVRYGRYLTTPVVIEPAATNAHPAGSPRPKARAFSAVTSSGFSLPTPTDFDHEGGTIHSYIAEPDVAELWDMEPAVLAARVSTEFGEAFPGWGRRVRQVHVQRWEHGLPLFSPGRVKHQSALEASTGDGMHFAGDYTAAANMEGALESGHRVAQQILAQSFTSKRSQLTRESRHE